MPAFETGLELKMAGKYLAEQERRVAKQRQLISTLRSEGRPTEAAQQALDDMLSMLAAMQKRRDFLHSRSSDSVKVREMPRR